MKIMLADDDKSLSMVVEHIITGMGHEFIWAKDGKDAVTIFFDTNPDLLILDVMMPKLDGFDVCSIVRQKSDVPIIFVTAKSDITDKSIGFKMGADDYLIKPFSPVELELRVTALLKRAINKNTFEAEMQQKDFLDIGNLHIDFGKYKVFKNDEDLFFTFTEFTLFSLLAKNQGQVFTRNQLVDIVWGRDYVGDLNILTVFIKKIRRKIEDEPAKPRYLLTVWGIGYKFAENSDFE